MYIHLDALAPAVDEIMPILGQDPLSCLVPSCHETSRHPCVTHVFGHVTIFSKQYVNPPTQIHLVRNRSEDFGINYHAVHLVFEQKMLQLDTKNK